MKALPTTRHELFCDLVLCCIIREHDTHKSDSILPELSSLDDLPDDLKSKLNNLCVLAYNAMMSDKIVLYSKDLQESHLPTIISSLGLLQAVEGLTKFSKTHSYNFLHLSVQELLAARHISQMSSSEQMTVFKKLFESSRFEAVLHYYSGFTKLVNPEIREFFCTYQHEKECFKDILPLLHCFFEAHEPSLCQLVDPFFAANIILEGITNPSDYLAIGYFISSLLCTSTADMPPVKLSDIGEVHCFKLLLNELPKYPLGEQPTSACAIPRKLILRLQLHRCDPSICYIVAKLIADNLKVSPAISELEWDNEEFQRSQDDGLFHIVEALQINSSLTKLSLVDVNLQYTEKNGLVFIKMLQVNKSLTHLDLSWNESFSHGAHCIFEGLQYNTSLAYLNLSHIGITATNPDTARSLIKMLKLNKSLKHLDLSSNKSFSLGAHYIFVEGLHCSLAHLNLRHTGITATDSSPFIKMLQENKSLTYLDLSLNKSFSLRAHCIFEGLQHNNSLSHLNLSCTGLTGTDSVTATAFIEMLQENKSLTHLDLSLNKSFSLGARCIFEGLQHNTSLVNLNLRRTGITATDDPDTVATFLIKMLQVNKSLTHLDLSFCSRLSDSVRQCIIESLQSYYHTSNLIELNLSKSFFPKTMQANKTSILY